MDVYTELMNVARLLKTVSVTGEYWTIMQACLNSVINVAKVVKEEQNAINNDDKP